MKASFYITFLSGLLLFSCKKEEESTSTNKRTNVVPFTQMTPTTAPTTATGTTSNSAYVDKENQKESVMYQYKYTMVKKPNTTTTTTATTVTPPGMNPPHGQPKHRCDIPVGAPLNSPVAKTTTTPKTAVVSTPTVTSTSNAVPSLLATTPEATPTPEGMNPPHGQPKHRCDIAVGAPLPKE
jgi:hypothetical protein